MIFAPDSGSISTSKKEVGTRYNEDLDLYRIINAGRRKIVKPPHFFDTVVLFVYHSYNVALRNNRFTMLGYCTISRYRIVIMVTCAQYFGVYTDFDGT